MRRISIPNTAEGLADFHPRMRSVIRAAYASGIEVAVFEGAKHDVCTVDGEVAHINDLPKLVAAAIAKLQRKEAA